MSLPLEKRFNLTYSHDSAVVIAVMIIDGYSHSFRKLNLPLEKTTTGCKDAYHSC